MPTVIRDQTSIRDKLRVVLSIKVKEIRESGELFVVHLPAFCCNFTVCSDSKLIHFSMCAWMLTFITDNLLGLGPSIRALLLPDSMQHGDRVSRKY